MKNIMKKIFVMLLAITLFLPILSTVVYAEEEEKEKTDAQIWEEKNQAYMLSDFTSLEQRLIGNSVIGKMELGYLDKDNGMALYVDSYTGEVIVLKLKKAESGDEHSKNGFKLLPNTAKEDEFYDYVSYWSTNPYNISSSKSVDQKDEQGNYTLSTDSSIKANLYSQIIIKFTEKSAEKTFFSYKDGAQYKQITTKPIKGGLRVEYVIGRLSVKYLVPEVISVDKWFDIYMKFKQTYGDREALNFAALYKFYIDDPNDPRVAEVSKECSFAAFSDLTADHIANHPASKKAGLVVCDTNIKEQERKRMEEKLRSFYTFEELDAAHAEMDFVSTDVESPVFRIALEYTLNEDGVSVRCNASNVRFDSDKYSLSNIMLLPYAGCGNVTNEDGFVFSPDGCGTIYSFDKVISTGVSSSDSVYGQDFAFSTIAGANKEVIRIPVFGICETEKIQKTTNVDTSDDTSEESSEASSEEPSEASSEESSEASSEESSEASSEETSEASSEETEDNTSTDVPNSNVETVYRKHGFFAIIEEGDSLAKIVIERQGTFHGYIQAYTAFNPRPKDTYALTGGISAGANALWTVEADRKYTGDFKLKIFILEEDECSYVGMAKKYRKYLMDKGILQKNDDKSEDMPLYLETIGAINSTDRFLGVPYEIKQELTTYENTVNILTQLSKEAGISNINVKLSAWVNGGLQSLVPSEVELVDELGGKKGFQQLVEYCNQNGFGLFPEFEFSYATENGMFDDFKPKKHLAKTIDNRNAYKKEYNPLLQAYVYTNKSIISTNSMLYFYESTYKDFAKYGIKNISVSSLGSDLSSDFNKKDPLNREDSKDLMMKLLEKMSKENDQVMVSGGNAYTWGYVDHILNLPLENTMHLYATASVPFLSFVLHGSTDYSGSAINLAGDIETYLLKTIENGASPYFIVAYENASELKANHVLTEYYSVRYSILKQSIVDIYGEVNDVLKYTKNLYMNDHEYIDDSYDVVKVGYSSDPNGKSGENEYVYYINYGDNAFTFVENGVEYTIDSLSYILVDSNGQIIK